MAARPRLIPALPPPAQPLPGWVRATASSGAGDPRFLAGGALALVDPLARSDHPLGQLWRQRLALACAAALAQQQGRGEDAGTIRDHLHLCSPGGDPGPAGRLLRAWHELCRAPALDPARWVERLPALLEVKASRVSEIRDLLPSAPGDPIAAAATLAAASLRLTPAERPLALWLADAMLARALRWPAPVPLLAAHFKRSDLRLALANAGPEVWVDACHHAYLRAAIAAVDLYADLSRRAGKLLAVAPQLRGKDADHAISRLLSEDAQRAGAGSNASDRSGRRLFDRLVQLGAVRELTGRATFRLYGL